MDNEKKIQISTQLKYHQSQSLNYGKVMPIASYVVRCPECDSSEDNVTTVSIIDGEVDKAVGTILSPDVKLHSARCKKCDWEKYF